MEKEAYSNYAIMMRRFRLKAKEKELGKAFAPSSPSKLPLSFAGFYFNTVLFLIIFFLKLYVITASK